MSAGQPAPVCLSVLRDEQTDSYVVSASSALLTLLRPAGVALPAVLHTHTHTSFRISPPRNTETRRIIRFLGPPKHERTHQLCEWEVRAKVKDGEEENRSKVSHGLFNLHMTEIRLMTRLNGGGEGDSDLLRVIAEQLRRCGCNLPGSGGRLGIEVGRLTCSFRWRAC